MLDTHLAPTDAVRLVPMEFGNSDVTIRQSNLRKTFQFSPAPLAISLPQPVKLRMREPVAMISILCIWLMMAV
jgi:hypothetical protein